MERNFKLTVLLSVGEQAQLQRLAEDEGLSGAQLLRSLAKRAYAKRFGETKATPTAATWRGLIEDVTGRAHYTAGNIAERMDVSVETVLRALEQLKKRGLLLHMIGQGDGSTWEAGANAQATLASAERKGFDLDEPLVEDG